MDVVELIDLKIQAAEADIARLKAARDLLAAPLVTTTVMALPPVKPKPQPGNAVGPAGAKKPRTVGPVVVDAREKIRALLARGVPLTPKAMAAATGLTRFKVQDSLKDWSAVAHTIAGNNKSPYQLAAPSA